MAGLLPLSTALADPGGPTPAPSSAPPAAVAPPPPTANKAHTPIEWGLLGASEASLLVDLMQTWQHQHRDRIKDNYVETNPLLGQHPSNAAMLGYFGGLMGANAAAWHFLPKDIRNLPAIGVLGLEVPQIERNWRMGFHFGF